MEKIRERIDRRRMQFGAFSAFLGVSLLKLDIYKNHSSNLPQFKVAHFLFITFLLTCKFLAWAIFGTLSPMEVKNLKDKISYTIWEFCMGFLIFLSSSERVTIDLLQREFWKFAGLFLCVLLLKSFHYLCVDRGKVIFQNNLSNCTPASNAGAATASNIQALHPSRSKNSNLHLVRFSLGLTLINFIDIMLITRFYFELYNNPQTTTKKNILIPLFGFEIINTFPLIVLTTIRFGLDYYEEAIVSPKIAATAIAAGEDESDALASSVASSVKEFDPTSWFDSKQRTLKIIEFLTNFVRFSMTCIFAICFLYFYTFPLHILPSSYLTFKVLLIKTRSLINYKKSQIKLSKLIRADLVEEGEFQHCIICLDDFSDINEVKRLPKCTHMFHLACLKGWLDYSSDCPICRQPV